MSFREFKYPDLLATFGLSWRTTLNLFPDVPPVAPDPAVVRVLGLVSPLASTLNTEKARSEWMTALVLGDFWARYGGQISLYSGADFQADPAAGLNGYCDFLLARAPQRPNIQPPAVVVVEAKPEDINDGLGQCIAGMVGAQRYNARLGVPAETVYGCVTTGSLWKFLRLEGTTLTFDLTEHTLHDLPHLLGILTHMIGSIPPAVQ